MEKVEQEGLVWLMSESNNRSNYTTTHLWEDCFSCRVETIVCSAKDFVREFGFAYKQIGAAFKQMATIYPTVFDHFQKRSEHRPIGFLAARYMDEQEKDDRCKLVAQAFSSFAAENK